jgi:hypothetical protein
MLFALIGAKALLFLYIWLLSSIAASYLSNRKGYGEKPGLATGLILSILGPIIWLFVPAKPESKWKQIGPFGRGEKAAKRPA